MAQRPKKLLDHVRDAIRLKHYTYCISRRNLRCGMHLRVR
jgi:hypothetical protein